MHLNTKCALTVSIATALVAAAPAVLPLHTLSPATYLWVTGALALVGVALNAYKAWAEHE